MLFHFILLVIGIGFLILSIFMTKWYNKLNDELEHGNPWNVEYEDYLLTAFYQWLCLPVSIGWIITCIVLLVIDFTKGG